MNGVPRVHLFQEISEVRIMAKAKMIKTGITGICILALLLVLSGGVVAEQPFKGKTIDLQTPHGVGGGFDTYCRTMKPFIEKYTGATVVVRNVKGAGGIVGRNDLYKAPPDGLHVALIAGAGSLFPQLIEAPGVKYDLTKMTQLARVTAEPHAMGVGTHTSYYTMDDMQQSEQAIRFGFSGVGSDDFYAAIIICDALGINMEPVPGYKGSHEANLAVLRQEVEGVQTTISTLLPLVKTRDIRPVLQISLERDLTWPGVPTALEVVPEDTRDTVVAISNMFALDRIMVGPPGMSEDKVNYWREIMDKVLTDPDFLEALEKIGRPLHYLPGDKVEIMVKEVADAGEKLIPRLKEAREQVK